MVKPRSLSATAVSKFELCPARWLAEDYLRARVPPGDAAHFGSALHDALEHFVVGGYHTSDQNWDALEGYYYKSYWDQFDTDIKYEEGLALLLKWHNKNIPLPNTVISAEVKENFEIPSSAGPITFNYILDRMDSIGPGEYEVVDYKSSMMPINPDSLRSNIQARCYGLAAQIKFKDAEKIWVTFDMLRHEQVGIVFSRQENIATWNYLKNLVERIIAYEGDPPQEVVNAQCHWCVRKASCKTLERVAASGSGVVMDAPQAADRRAALDWARKGINAALDELDEAIVQYCEAEEITEFTTDVNHVRLTLPKKRQADGERIKELLPDEIVKKYGSLGVTAVDKILKNEDLDDATIASLQDMVFSEYGHPKPKIQALNPIEE